MKSIFRYTESKPIVNKWLILLVVPLTLTLPAARAAVKNDFVEKAILLEKSGDRAGAMLQYDKALHQNPNDSVALIDRANLRFNSGDRQGALSDVQRALKVNAIDFNALRTRADFEAASGETKRALADYTEALKWNPNDSSSYTSRGITRAGLGEKKLALADFGKAIAIDNNVIARFNRMRLNANKTAAQHEYEELTKLVAKTDDDYLALSNAHVQFGYKEKAVAELSKSLEINPTHTQALFNRAVLRAELGKREEALADYNKYIELNGSNAKVFFNRSLLKEQLKDREGAMKDLKRAIELDANLKLQEGTNKPFQLMLS